jgi:hypothetical protein
MDSRVQIVAILATALQFVVVFELVRRRSLMERYALLWMLSSAVMLGLSIWRGALEELSSLVGIAYAPSALFLIAFGFVLLMLLHFSLVISKLADENKVLAQKLGLLQQRVDDVAAPLPPQEAPEVRASEYAAPGRRS